MNQNTLYNFLKSFPALTRWGVSLAVSFSAATAYIVFKNSIDSSLIFTVLGVLLLAGGASALNQYQEREIDVLMSRTKNRPIPSQKISPLTGLIASLLLCIPGLLFLFLKAGFIPALLGFFNIIWYNGFYTYLKRKTAFAVVPGSLTGVAPLLIGWTAAGGNILHPTIIFISFFIYMWQIPHFWLLLIKYHDDYQKAGLGTLYSIFSKDQAKHVVFVWIVATSIASFFLPVFGIIQSLPLILGLIMTNIWIVISFYFIIFNKTEIINYKKAFISINTFMLVVMAILIADSLMM